MKGLIALKRLKDGSIIHCRRQPELLASKAADTLFSMVAPTVQAPAWSSLCVFIAASAAVAPHEPTGQAHQSSSPSTHQHHRGTSGWGAAPTPPLVTFLALGTWRKFLRPFATSCIVRTTSECRVLELWGVFLTPRTTQPVFSRHRDELWRAVKSLQTAQAVQVKTEVLFMYSSLRYPRGKTSQPRPPHQKLGSQIYLQLPERPWHSPATIS